MVDLKAKPFYLDDEQIKWVEDTIAGMTYDEKVGQLFICINPLRDVNYYTMMCEKYHVGGVRWQGGTLEEIYEQNRIYQEKSKIPVLIAANCEAGGNGAVKEGTYIASGAACGASTTTQTVRDMAAVGAKEAKTVGCNWTFAPVCDVVSNPKNTIVNTRAFGDDPDLVLERSIAYMKEMNEHGLVCAAKHFPGDGSEERDQHLVMGCNDLSVEEWDASFGKVYKGLIDEGLQSIMVGHICQPAYSRKLRPGIKDEEIMPGTMAPELLQDLLRGQLGFNGLILTDASHMAGLNAAGSRKDVVPGVIAAGCDMVLFFNDPAEDIQYMKDGIESGLISAERLDDALHRILGLKAHAGLHKLQFPSKDGLSIVGCKEHHELAKKAADESITLVKDTQGLLPIRPEEKKNCLLYFVQSTPMGLSYGPNPAKVKLIEELTAAGFNVTAPADFYELEKEQSNPGMNMVKMMLKQPMEEMKKKYDFVLVALSMTGYAQTNNVRVNYSVGHSNEIPWYIHEIPTICVSLQYTNHLFDVPMMKTFVNAYSPTDEYIESFVEKMTGKSEFKGVANELVWGGRWETRL